MNLIYSKFRTFLKRIIKSNFYLIVFILISILTLLGLFNILDKLKEEELSKIELYASSQKLLFQEKIEVNEVRLFLLEIAKKNTTIPVVLVDENDAPLLWKNYDDNIFINPTLAKEKIKELKTKYPPIKIDVSGKKQFIYYEESSTLRKLKYYPTLIVIFYVFLLLIMIWNITVIENNRKTNLWTGMAKETAHQLGTPLTSIAGWLQLLKDEVDGKDAYLIKEIEKDVFRLNKIAFRFSKIGSNPELKKINIIESLRTIFDYLRVRISPKIDFNLVYNENSIEVMLDEDLFSWVVENLVNNSLDSIEGKGEIIIGVVKENRLVKLYFKDSGKGIDKEKFRDVFEPGFSTKKRGWGLGLSLAKRIVKEYHKGKIYVKESEINKGTIFVIELPTIDS